MGVKRSMKDKKHMEKIKSLINYFDAGLISKNVFLEGVRMNADAIDDAEEVMDEQTE